MTPREVLGLQMQLNDAGAETVRDYLIALLEGVWKWKEAFDGKRPFGNSDWDDELAVTLVGAGAVDGVLTSEGYIEDCDWDALDAAIAAAIRELR